MADPLVCAVMLTRDRPEMAARAVRCFNRQTYENKRLLVYDTSNADQYGYVAAPWLKFREDRRIGHVTPPSFARDWTVGALRNAANDHAYGDIIAHWDDDDISQPDRITQQVAMLQQTGAECVGYREMLFWREVDQTAWLYKHGRHDYAVGTSLCYWRSAWGGNKFRDTSRGEDLDFIKGVKVFGVSSFAGHMPMMIATIHDGNVEHYGGVGQVYAPEFQRVTIWDEQVRRIMEAA